MSIDFKSKYIHELIRAVLVYYFHCCPSD